MELIVSRLNNNLISRKYNNYTSPIESTLFVDFIIKKKLIYDIIDLAIYNGHLGLVKYLKRKCFDFDEYNIEIAKKYNYLNIVKYLEKRC